MKKALFFLLFVSVLAHARWDLNDVSYLMPLPKSVQEDHLLRMESSALGGYLLHPSFITQIPKLTMPITPEEAIGTLRVVAIRIDPCFPLPTPQTCQRQVRLVWQPLEFDRKQNIRTADAALHSFYRLSDEAFVALLKDIAIWKKRFPSNTQGLPLHIHPAWARQGNQSPALYEFQRVIVKHIGMRNFFRVTGMFLRGAGDMWAFANYELRNGDLAPQPVPRLNGKASQTFVNHSVPSTHFTSAAMAPKAKGEDILDPLLGNPSNPGPVPEEQIVKSFRAIYRIENPRTFNPENMDCVSCHIAQPMKYAYFAKRPDLGLSQIWKPDQYFNPRYNLRNLTRAPHDTQIIRAFGYFGTDPILSQRVINESAEVADWLNRALGFN